ncbi:MAG: metallophosphoesterase [Pyrinomonadaceae bacterium]|nr:metallophosphoesterase [Pyrinomonadaceae bacterium]
MGWRFTLKDANIVAYLTSDDKGAEPRISHRHLVRFLDGLNESLSNKLPVFLSDNSEWITQISKETKLASKKVRSFEPPSIALDVNELDKNSLQYAFAIQQTRSMPGWSLGQILYGLRELFCNFELYALPFDPNYGKITEIAEKFAIESEEKALILLPIDFQREASDQNDTKQISFLDPFPAVSTLANSDLSEPGMLLWTNSGAAHYITDLDHIYQALSILKKSPPGHAVQELNDFLTGGSGFQGTEILHLSDLHFGTKHAYENRTRLKNELRKRKNGRQQVVITGDLFEILHERDFVDFEDFRTDLIDITGKEAIVIPGNHDQRFAGNSFGFIGRDSSKVAALEWTNVHVDHQGKCVFFCFDSSFEKNMLAKGKFSDREKETVENSFNTKLLSDGRIEDYFRVTLIHHHPFSFDTNQESIIQRLLVQIGMTDEPFLAMDRSEALIKWCANMEIPLILHGHKHVQRHFTKKVLTKFDRHFYVTAAGCGASLGAENNPLTYNVISYNDKSKNFAITFFEDDKTGGGFAPAKIALQVVA